MSTLQIEEGHGGPDATTPERRAIEERVTVVEPGIVLMREISVQTPFSIDVMHDRAEALCEGWPRLAMVVDLRDARRPNAITRQALRRRIGRLAPRVVHTAFIVGINRIMAAMAKLVGVSFGYRSVSLHDTVDDAIEEARRALRR